MKGYILLALAVATLFGVVTFILDSADRRAFGKLALKVLLSLGVGLATVYVISQLAITGVI